MLKQVLSVMFGAMVCVSLTGCDVDVKDEGELPSVGVEIEEGRLPDVDVKTPDVEVETKTLEVEVPDVNVDIPQENDEVINANAEDKD